MSETPSQINIFAGDHARAEKAATELDSETFRFGRWVKLARFSLFALASFLCIWPFFDPVFRNIENDLVGLVCFPVAVGLSLFLLAAAFGSGWQYAAGWCAVLLVGQAASLQLVNAGWQLRYQHYRPLNEIVNNPLDLIMIGVLLIQAALVLNGLRAIWSGIAAWCRRHLTIWQLLLIATIFVVSTTTVSHSLAVYFTEWSFAVLLQVLSLATVMLMSIAIPQGSVAEISRRLSDLFGSEQDESAQSGLNGRFVLSLASAVVVVAAILSVFSYERHPHVPDEVAYLTHARIFASGALTLSAPPVPAGFEVFLLEVNGGRWYPVPPPGWPMVLALGVLIGIPWMVNPILAGVNVLLGYFLLREMYARHVACLSIFLLAVSPWYIFLGMSLLTHMASLTCALLAAIGVAWCRRDQRAVWAWLAGLALGMLSLVRPLEAVAVAGLLGLWAIGLGGRRIKATAIAGLIAGSLIVGGLGLAYNTALTGNPTEFPVNAYTDRHFGKNSNALGFGPDRGLGWALDPYPGHGPVDALVNTNLNVSALNTELFGWSIGSFLLVAAGLFVGRPSRSDYLMIAVIAAIYVSHFFYYFSGGPDFGARYWFLMIVPLVVLTARGIAKVGSKLDAEFTGGGSRVYAAVLVLCAISLIAFVPWRAIDKYHNFRGMRPDIRYLAAEHKFGRSLVLITGNKHPDFDSAMVYNPLDLSADLPIYAWDRDAATRKELLREYADRPVWIIEAPSVTGHGYRVAAGPLSSGTMLQDVEKSLAENERSF